MKRTSLFLMPTAIFLLSTIQPAAAQKPDRAPQRRQADPGRGGDFERGDRPRRRRRTPDTAMDLIRKLPKLQASMRGAFDLDPSQEDAILELFEQETDRLKQLHLESKGPAARNEDIDEAKELLTELAEAREAGDRERARQLRKEIGRVLNGQRNSRGPAVRIDRFLRDVQGELDDDQRSTFRDLVRNAGIRQPRPRREGRFQLMRRALFSPEVDLSQEQRQEIMDLFRQLRPQGDRGPRGNAPRNARSHTRGNRGPRAGERGQAGPQGRRPSPEQRAEQFKQFEQSVLELLSKEQRESLATAMDTLKDSPPEQFDGRRWRQGRRDRPQDGQRNNWQEGSRNGRRDGGQDGRRDRQRGRRDHEEPD